MSVCGTTGECVSHSDEVPVEGEGMLGMAELPDGSLWIAGRTLHRFDGEEWTQPAAPEEGFSVLLAEGSDLLIALTAADGSSRVAKWTDGRLKKLPIFGAMKHVQRLFCDSKGHLWISTGGSGLLRFDGEKTKSFRAQDGLPSDVVYGIAEQPPGTLWVATRKGLARVVDDQVSDLSAVRGTPTRSPVHVLPDDFGRIWVTADDGIHRLDVKELNQAVGSKEPLKRARVFGTRDGLASVEVSWRSGGAARTADGTLYFATNRGLSQTRPQKVRPAPQVGEVRWDTVWVGGERLNHIPESIEIDDRRKSIQAAYHAPSLSSADVEFRHRLIGYRDAWRVTGRGLSSEYGNLPPGDYVLEIGARRRGGPWVKSNKSLRLTVQPLVRDLVGATQLRDRGPPCHLFVGSRPAPPTQAGRQAAPR